MFRIRGTLRAVAAAAALVFVTAGSARAHDDAAKPAHHSKLKGAAVGGAGGAVVGGKKGAALGAVGGALYQHHKNKKAEKAAEKANK